MKKNIIAAGLLLIPALGFAQGDAAAIKALEKQAAASNDAALTNLLNNTEDAIAANNPSSRYAKINTNASKIDAIKGTWIITYKIDTVIYTDKLVITGSKTSNGDITASAVIYEDLGDAGIATVCSYDPVKYSAIESDYLCVNTNETYVHNYSFKFSGDTITGGFYGIGLDSDAATASILLKNIPIKGYRELSAAEYNTTTGLLNLPQVNVGNDVYSAVLKNKGAFVFTLESSTKIK
jgi:hypothetical protein